MTTTKKLLTLLDSCGRTRYLLLTTAVASLIFASTHEANAELVVRQLDKVISGSTFGIDLDLDGEDDFLIVDSGEVSSSILTTNRGAPAAIFMDPTGSFPSVFQIGDSISSTSGASSDGQVLLYGQENSPFSKIGDKGFVGLSIFNAEVDDSNFGFLEITRGSTILGALGYQTTAGAPAMISIPEPTTLTSVLALLLGLSCKTRRN